MFGVKTGLFPAPIAKQSLDLWRYIHKFINAPTPAVGTNTKSHDLRNSHKEVFTGRIPPRTRDCSAMKDSESQTLVPMMDKQYEGITRNIKWSVEGL